MINIDDVEYKSKAQLERAFSACKMRLRGRFDDSPCNMESIDGKWMWRLIEAHPRYEDKIPSNAESFRITTIPEWRGLNIVLVDEDGKDIIIPGSTKPCTVGKDGLCASHFPRTVNEKRNRALDAFRRLVASQVHDVRARAGHGQRRQHVGHIGVPFAKIVVQYLESKGYSSVESVDLRRVHARSGEFALTDDTLANDFMIYHREHATMAMQDAHENMSENYANKRSMWSAEEKMRAASKKAKTESQ